VSWVAEGSQSSEALEVLGQVESEVRRVRVDQYSYPVMVLISTSQLLDLAQGVLGARIRKFE